MVLFHGLVAGFFVVLAVMSVPIAWLVALVFAAVLAAQLWWQRRLRRRLDQLSR